MADKKQKNAISKLSFEEAIKELTSIVSKIEQGQIPLQDSLEQYERGMALIKHCRGILQQAEKRIEKISAEEKSEDSSQKTDDR
ncbi:MAG: exodeoxyribonuclease VII small subunit [Planctomycetota bacterium]|nr:exodeoxyribonuclease VII small subunit [Planctomycetota bacterium]